MFTPISRHAITWFGVLALSVTLSACTKQPGDDHKLLTGPDEVVENPTISAFEPTVIAANVPTEIRITGTGFLTGAKVRFAFQPAASVSVIDSNTIMATSPALPEGFSYAVEVTNPN